MTLVFTLALSLVPTARAECNLAPTPGLTCDPAGYQMCSRNGGGWSCSFGASGLDTQGADVTIAYGPANTGEGPDACEGFCAWGTDTRGNQFCCETYDGSDGGTPLYGASFFFGTFGDTVHLATPDGSNRLTGDQTIFYGGPLSTSFYLYDGADTLDASGGDVTLVSVYGGPGNDWIMGSSGIDTVYGEGGSDEIYGDGGDDMLYGGDNADWISGDAGDDMLYGDAGNDEMRGERGNDLLLGGFGADTLVGGDGNDDLDGEEGADLISGETGRDVAYGGAGNDLVCGQGDNDKLYGEGGNDTLVGGGGTDKIVAGSGTDACDDASGTGCEGGITAPYECPQ